MTAYTAELLKQAPILDNLFDAIMITDTSGCILYWNAAAEAMYGYTLKEVRGKSPVLVHLSEDIPILQGQILQELQETGHWHEEVEFQRKDGSRGISDVSITALKLPGGEPYATLGVNRDITARKQTELRLAESEIRSRRQAQELGLLYQVHTALTRPIELNELFQAIVTVTVQTLHFDHAGLYLVQGEELVCQANAGCFPALERIPISQGIIGRVARTGLAVFLETVDRDPDYVSAAPEVQSEVCIPLRRAGQVAGVLNVENCRSGSLGLDDFRLLTTISEHVEIAMERAYLFAERRAVENTLERRAEALTHLFQSSLEINAQVDLSRLLHSILERAARLAKADLGGVFLSQENKPGLYLVVLTPEHLPPGFELILSIGESLTNQVIASGQPLWVEDYSTWEGRIESLQANNFRRTLAMPLKAGGKIIGAITLTDTSQGGPFDAQDVQMVSLFASQAAIAIENTRLISSVQRELEERRQVEAAEREQRLFSETLRDTAAALSAAQGLNEVLRTALNSIIRIVPHEASAILLREGERASFLMRRGYQTANEFEETIPDYQLDIYATPNLGRMVDTGRPVLIADTQAEPKWIVMPGYHLRSYVGAPLRVKGRVIGFFNLHSILPGFFTHQHAERLLVFADQTAMSIENARLMEETTRRAQRLAIVNELSLAINQSMQLETMLETALQALACALQVQQGGVALFNAQRGTFRLVVDLPAQGSTSAVGTEFLPDQYEYMKLMIETKQALVYEDVQHDPRMADIWDLMRARHIVSMLLVPMILDGKIIGSFGFDAIDRQRQFSAGEIALVQTVANLAATRVQQAHLFEAERQAREQAENNATELHLRAHQMSLLNDITRSAVSEANLEELLRILADRLGDLIEADGAFIVLWNEATADSQVAFDELRLIYPAVNIELGQRNVAAAVLETGMTLAIDDLNASSYREVLPGVLPDSELPVQAILGLPMSTGGRRLGAALISFKNVHSFTADEIRLCEQAAAQIALAIVKAESLQAAKFHADQLARTNLLLVALSEVAARVERASMPDEVIHSLGVELRRLDIHCLVTQLAETNLAHDPLLYVRYLSVDNRSIQLMEQLTGMTLGNFHFNLAAIETFQAVMQTRQAVFANDLLPKLLQILPELPVSVARQLARLAGVDDHTGALYLPIVIEDHVQGILILWGNTLQQEDLSAASIFTSQISVTLEKAHLYEELQQLAITDELTRLYNRRGLYELGRREVERALRFKRSLSAIMLDIDHFKSFNDIYGHAIGDEILSGLADRCRANFRDIDIIGRYGGEEFVILLPENEVNIASQVAERLRHAIVDKPFETSVGPLLITVSLGVSTLLPSFRDLSVLIDSADAALYQAKRQGRNQVVTQ